MFCKNDWIYSNYKEKIKNPELDLLLSTNLKNTLVKKMSFEEACDYTAIQIKNDHHKKIHICFSGGIDSEKVVRVFHRNKIDFVPLIVLCDNNFEETKNAFDVCLELNLNPLILTMHENDLNAVVFLEILGTLKSNNMFCAPEIFACKNVTTDRGIIVDGGEPLDCLDVIKNTKFGLAQGDAYAYCLYTEKSIAVPFFYYTPEIFYSYVDNVDLSSEDNVQLFKSKLYGLKYRPKYRPKYPQKIDRLIQWKAKENEKISKNYFVFGGKTQTLNMFRDHVEKF